MMDDMLLEADIGDQRIYVTTLSDVMYRRAGGHGLGGSYGYFICAGSISQPEAGFEVLAKAKSMDAAQFLFNAITAP